MVNPNKYIRKALYDAIIPFYDCFDTQVTGNTNTSQYVIISTQDKEDLNPNKCAHRWQVATLLDIVVIYNGAGNVGSRVVNDDMEETIKNAILNLNVSGFNVLLQRNEYPSNLDSSSETQTVYRNFIRVILTLE